MTIAAMPSLHYGTSVFAVLRLVEYSPLVFHEDVALLWPVLMGWTVGATTNRFVVGMWFVSRWLCARSFG